MSIIPVRVGRGLEHAFYRGDHEEILKKTVDSTKGHYIVSDLSPIIGALAYLGRTDEAEHLFQKNLRKLSRETESAARCFLGTALCRQSRYEEAQAHFRRNLRFRKHRNRVTRVYAFQGLGFYRYFCGRYAKALAAGRRAFHAAIESRFLYGKFLAADLMAHSLIQVGQVAEGLHMLEEALGYSKQLSEGEIDSGVWIASACYQAQFGISPAADLTTLQKLHKSLSPQDSYSQSSLLLEMGRQLSLRGQHSASQAALNQACQLIYSSRHRRQGVTLNLRYAHNLYLKGELHQALNLVRVSAKELDHRVDKALELQLVGMELRLKRALGITTPDDPLQQTLAKLTHYTGMGVARRIMNRSAASPTGEFKVGEDPLGDLIEKASRGGNDAVEAVLQSGYLSLLRECLPIQPGETALYFDLIPDSVLIVDGGDLEFQSRGVSQIIRALARELERNECSKERLIERVWGYKYDRLRHDSLIYPAISRLRQLLGSRAGWVEATEHGYRLRAGVRAHFPTPTPVAARTVVADESPSEVVTSGSALNHRQLMILRHFEKEEFLDVQTCQKIFSTSKITATRDLSGLHKLALIQRVGKGRATRYRSNHFTGGSA